MRVIITGTGINIYYLAKKFISKGYQISIICDNKSDCDYFARNLKALVICGDPSDPELMNQSKAYAAEIFIGMTLRDQDNLIVCQMAREYYQIPRILAVVNDPDNEEVFRKIGVRAISNSRFLIETIESMSALDEIKQQISVVEGKVMLTELEISSASRIAGKLLQDIQIPFSALIATVLRGDEVIIPRGNTVLLPQDRILLITLPENHSMALNIFS
jgi:trk system potassium uptake protein TrkA